MRLNATLRRGDEIESITPERAAELLAEKRAKGPAPKKRAAKSPAKKAPAKKAAASTTAKKAAAKRPAAKKAAANAASFRHQDRGRIDIVGKSKRQKKKGSRLRRGRPGKGRA